MGAADLLLHVRAIGIQLRATDDHLLVTPASRLTDELRALLRASKPELMALLAAELPTPDPDSWCWPHSSAMNGAEIAAFIGRVQRFVKLGLSEGQAETLADRLVNRDRQQDDRRLCLECANYWPGYCGDHRMAGLNSSELGRDLAALPQRCPGFRPSPGQGPPK